ncbi:hypothetical protein, partial [Mesorhizobium sp. M1E.F.Ca.ET.041.01.1.1]|uniref:hypothetical protein n=1 Tax=Mesorhizobium sp. M1E.F.Ca.ET.041.01.1.1 TaxID=2496759 RepID=UPI001AEC771F
CQSGTAEQELEPVGLGLNRCAGIHRAISCLSIDEIKATGRNFQLADGPLVSHLTRCTTSGECRFRTDCLALMERTVSI